MHNYGLYSVGAFKDYLPLEWQTILLEDTFTDTDLIGQKRAFNPYTVQIQMNEYHHDKQDDRLLDQQNMGTSGEKDMTDDRQNNNSRQKSLRIS